MTALLANITIPTYNRAPIIGRAVEAALAQSYLPLTVTVIDDGSTDETPRVLRHFESDPRFSWIRLGRNLGTAQAKNVAIALCRYDAITFHDSDDIPSPHKLLHQARALETRGHHADPMLDWEPLGRDAGEELMFDVVVGAFDFFKLDGKRYRICNRISLVDDFFPQLQVPSQTEGDWCLINAGLFRRRVFETLGGYLDSIEEDRELRNRTLAAGCAYYFVDEPLLTKIEMSDSLTVAQATSFRGETRARDRDEVWRRNRLYRGGLSGPAVADRCRVTLDLSGAIFEEVGNPQHLSLQSSVPMTSETRAHLRAQLAGPARAGLAS